MPTPSTYKVISPPSCLPVEARVEELIDSVNGTWKNEQVQQVFLLHEADVICGVALSSKLPADRQVWAPTANGLFSTRSAYKIAVEMASRDASGTASDSSNLRRFWKYIWCVNVPHKVCNFTWRACKNILPTKENLVRRRVLMERCCEECQAIVESSGHFFWECPRAREIWSTSELFPMKDDLHFNSFMDSLWYAVMEAQWDQDCIKKIMTVLWAMWTNRNEIRNGGEKKISSILLQGASDYLWKYQSSSVELVM